MINFTRPSFSPHYLRLRTPQVTRERLRWELDWSVHLLVRRRLLDMSAAGV